MSNFKFSFEKLDVWHLAKNLALKIYQTTNIFPKKELFCLTSQMNRAAISVSSNIAEGSSRKSTKDQIHFYNLAFSSLTELYSQVLIANELNYIQNDQVDELRNTIFELSNKLNALVNSNYSKLNKSTNQQINKQTNK